MPISKELRTLGQSAAALSAASLALASFHSENGAKDAIPFLILMGANNAAVVAGFAGVLATLYFLVRAWDEALATAVDQAMSDHDATGQQSQIVPSGLGDRVAWNLRMQAIVKGVISAIDFWLPVVLAGIVTLVLWSAMFAFLAKVGLSIGMNF
jgi:hypothetical protein